MACNTGGLHAHGSCHGFGPEQVVGAGQNGGVPVRLHAQRADDVKGKFQVLRRGGGLVLHNDPALVYAVGGEPVKHALGFGHVLALALTAADDGNALRVLLHVVQHPPQPVYKGEGGVIPVDGSAQHHQVGPLRVLVRAGVFDDGNLHNAKIRKADTHQHHHDPPQKDGQKLVHQDQRRNKGQGIRDVSIAPQGKAEHQGRQQQYGRSPAPDRDQFQFAHPFSSSHCSYSASSSSSRGPRCSSISISFW